MAGIYTRDNLAQLLNTGLENAMKRQSDRTKTENARLAESIKALNSFVKSVGYAEEDDLEKKLKQLQMEKIAAQKAQEDANQAVLDANERSLAAEQKMQGYRPSSVGFPDTESASYQLAMMNGYRPSSVGSAYEQIMQGYRPSMPTRQPTVPAVNQAYMSANSGLPQPGYNYWDVMQGIYRRNR